MGRARLPLVFVLAAAAALACSGEEPQRPVPRILEAIAERDVVSGEALATSTITVTMDRSFSLVSSRIPLASRFELFIPNVDGQIEGPVFVQNALRDTEDPNVFVLEVTRLLPEGSSLSIARAAFRDGEEGTVDAEVQSDLSAAQVLMALTQFRFGDTAVLRGGAGQAAPDPDEQDVEVQRAMLVNHMNGRGEPPEVVAAATARFDSLPPEIVPSPKLRAAISALTGTFAEPVHDYLFTGANCTGQPAALVAFQPPPDAPELLARSTRSESGQIVISINPRLVGETIEHLMPLMTHEAVHCDEVDGLFEEIAATAFDTLLYMMLLVPFPELTLAGTDLSRELNVAALAMLNSGRLIPESGGVLPTAGVRSVLPGSNTGFPSFADLVAASYPQIDFTESPTEDLAVTYARSLSAPVGMAASDPFDLVYLDELVARSFTAEMLIALFEALSLEPA